MSADSNEASVQSVVHTPGPWTAGKPQWKRGGPPYKIPINSAGGTVANVLTHESIQWNPPEQCDPQPNGDARLIAAAPDMLKTLRACVAWFEDNDLDPCVLDDVKDAIKNATGEQV
jgi:hypothetical protein